MNLAKVHSQASSDLTLEIPASTFSQAMLYLDTHEIVF